MFEKVLPLLLRGEFICHVSYPEAYEYLSHSKNGQDAQNYLAKIGLNLQQTEQKSAFYVVYQQLDEANRKASKDEFTLIKQQLRPLVQFMALLLRVTNNEEILATGATLKKHELMAKIDANHDLALQLTDIANQFSQLDKTTSGRLDKLLKQLEKNHYLVLSNAEREIYQLTGKIEYLQQVIDYLMEHEGIVEVEEQGETGLLC
jgi:hypothetical protein